VQIQVRPFEPAPDEAADPAQLEVLLQSVDVLAQAVETLTQAVDTLTARAGAPTTVTGAEAVLAPRTLEVAPLAPVQALALGVEVSEEELARRGEVQDPEVILAPEPPDLRTPEAPGETGEGAEPAPPAATVRPAVADEDLLARGRQVYGAACVRCHLPDGQGREDVASLRDNEVVQGEVSRLARVPVSGHGNMPSIITLTDGDLAAVLSYLRTSFGNDAAPVSEDEIAQLSAFGR
jgi:mono/diheme cytochrome c family protein